MLVAEQGLFREGLRSLIEHAWEFCTIEEAGSGLDLTLRTAVFAADLLVLDWAVPSFPASEALHALTAAVPVVVLWDHHDQPDQETLRASGVARLIDKRHGATALLEVVRDIVSRRPRMAAISGVQHFGLTPRESEILTAVASAYPNREIAQRLTITEDTVKRHLTSIFDKLGVSNRVELTLYAVHHGLLDGSTLPEKPQTRPRTSRPPRRILPWRAPLMGAR